MALFVLFKEEYRVLVEHYIDRFVELEAPGCGVTPQSDETIEEFFDGGVPPYDAAREILRL